MTLPLFDRNEGNIYEAAQRASKAEDEHQALRLQLLARLQQASTQLSTARASASALRTTVLPAAQAAQDAATKGFEAGKFGLLASLIPSGHCCRPGSVVSVRRSPLETV